MIVIRCLLLFLDAFRFDFINKKDTPFLYKLGKEGIFSNLITLPGYHIEYSIMSGRLPTTHNIWTWYYLNPEGSPFKWLRRWNFLFRNIDKTILSKHLRSFITYYTSFKRYRKGHTRFLKINKMPLDKAPLFGITVDKNFVDKEPMRDMKLPTLFDILRKHGKKYLASEWPVLGTDEKVKVQKRGGADKDKFALLKRSVKDDYDFRFCHFWNLDSKMHKYGINHHEVKEHVRALDKWIEELVTALREKEPTTVVMFSDHGMVPIKRTVNVIGELESIGLSEKDYIILPDSTIVRIWLKDKSKKGKIVKKLESMKCGRIFDEKNVSELDIPYNRDHVGDLMFMVDPGLQISPNFFQGDDVAKAMHGYVKHDSGLEGIFIVNGPKIKSHRLKDVTLLDIFPTTLRCMGFKPPKDCEGKVVKGV